jgi:hypothetical protein
VGRSPGTAPPPQRDDDEDFLEDLDPARVPPGSLRHRLRSNPATKLPYRVGVFVLGLVCIAVGIGLAVLPGPLTIPPVLLGLWIWSWEFAFAQSLFDSFERKAREAWEHAKEHPVSSAAVTAGGLVMAGVAIWAVGHFELVDEGRAALGI